MCGEYRFLVVKLNEWDNDSAEVSFHLHYGMEAAKILFENKQY